MKYQRIVRGEFLDRPNRFIAHVKVDGVVETVHVKNTGRCGELLIPGCEVYLEKSDNPTRKTAYDLITVRKGKRLVNMDSQAPNQVVREWLETKKLFPEMTLLQPEKTYGKSRVDFYLETTTEKVFIEVKGVTREQDDIVCFPDAPSERAIKHLGELMEAKKQGYRAIVFFVIQMENVRYFTPDVERHEAFARKLREAVAAGVEVLAMECKVQTDSLTIHREVPVSLDGKEPVPGDDGGQPASAFDLTEIISPLQDWYAENKRSLPWRENISPYRVWISEIMLQQTRVEAVKPYFKRFMERLPQISDLAHVEDEELLKLWEGLGYYGRARNLKIAANQILDDYHGELPGDLKELLKLQGIGSYTAGAIASIAFGLPYPAVDGNVLRVLSRLRKDERRIDDAKVKKAVEEELTAIMPQANPGVFNQALMELGACVCVPNGEPVCTDCPIQHLCQAHREQVESEYPKKEKAKARKIEKKTVLILKDKDQVVLRKRPEKGLLAGMYELPWLEGHVSVEEVVQYLGTKGLSAIRVQKLTDAKHIFSHIEWHMQGYMVRVDELRPREDKEPSWIYVDPMVAQQKYPLPSAFEAYTKYLNMKLGKSRLKENDI